MTMHPMEDAHSARPDEPRRRTTLWTIVALVVALAQPLTATVWLVKGDLRLTLSLRTRAGAAPVTSSATAAGTLPRRGAASPREHR